MLRWSIIILIYSVFTYYSFELIRIATRSNWLAYVYSWQYPCW